MTRGVLPQRVEVMTKTPYAGLGRRVAEKVCLTVRLGVTSLALLPLLVILGATLLVSHSFRAQLCQNRIRLLHWMCLRW